MAIKVHCQQCRKKISIDEAFAGGNCRCPYCKAITMVSGGGAAVAHTARPDSPTEIAASQVRQAKPAEAVPLAKPVKVQGIVTLVLSVFVLLLVAGVLLVVKISTGTDVNNNNCLPTNPFTVKTPNVAGMSIAGPVVYVLDGSLMGQDLCEPAGAVVRYSILSLGFRGKFNVVVLNAEGFKPLGDKWLAGGEDGDTKAKEFLDTHQPAGATDLTGAIRRALAMNPKTVVVLSVKAVGGADELVQQAKRAGVGIFTIMLDSPPDTVKVMKKLAAETSGKCRQFASDNLVELISEAPALP